MKKKRQVLHTRNFRVRTYARSVRCASRFSIPIERETTSRSTRMVPPRRCLTFRLLFRLNWFLAIEECPTLKLCGAMD